MTDYDLSEDELETLASFDGPDQPEDVDPLHFAKLLSMALVEQKEGGPVITETGYERLAVRGMLADKVKRPGA